MPTSPAELVKLVLSYRAQLGELRARYEEEIALLREQIRVLKARLYGQKSEKSRVEAEEQLCLFDLPEPEGVEEEESGEEEEVSGYRRKRRGRKPLPEDLPRVEVVHDIAEEEKVCGCGCRLVRIGEETSEQLDVVPARVRVIVHIRPKYACPCCEGAETEEAAVKIAPMPKRLLPKSLATAGLLAHVLTAKYVDHVPLYRQEEQFRRIGVEISRGTMSRWAVKASEACQPLLNLLREEVLEGGYVQVDETRVQVLKEPGRAATTQSYMWVFREGDESRHPVVVYEYHQSRSGEVAKRFLEGFRGYVQTDGHSGYDYLDRAEGVRHVGCWAHVRRKYTDVVKAQGKNRRPGGADKALSYIRKLYNLERSWKREGLGPDEVCERRQEHAGPVLEKFRRWLESRHGRTPPKGLLGQAIAYTLKQWPRLVVYLEDGRLRLDNNGAENAIRPFTVGRKNWLFSQSMRGAEASALLYSLVETSKANGLEPWAYLRHIFERLPTATELEDLEALLPWNVTLSTP